MRFQISTKVKGQTREVFAAFDKSLLSRLVPPGMRLKLIQFDEPTRVGGVVHIEVTMFGLIKQEWYNEITEYQEGDAECWFVDEGVRLPKMLKYWRHKHLIRAAGEGVEIVDDVTYEGRWKVLGWLLYLPIRLQFVMRKPTYRKVFGKI
ncbi:MAG: hypothetical protein AAF570_20245 [Bacteroidota bacterium]